MVFVSKNELFLQDLRRNIQRHQLNRVECSRSLGPLSIFFCKGLQKYMFDTINHDEKHSKQADMNKTPLA